MAILITGGAGYIGRHTAKRLAETGHDVVALDNLSTSGTAHFPWGKLIVGDIADTHLVASILRSHRISTVIHLAASAHVGQSMAEPYLYFRNNVSGSLALFETMVAERVLQVIFASSCAIYGTTNLPVAREDGPFRPASPYGESKLQIERSLRWYNQAFGLRLICLRYFNVAGAVDALGEDIKTSLGIIPKTLDPLSTRRYRSMCTARTLRLTTGPRSMIMFTPQTSPKPICWR